MSVLATSGEKNMFSWTNKWYSQGNNIGTAERYNLVLLNCLSSSVCKINTVYMENLQNKILIGFVHRTLNVGYQSQWLPCADTPQVLSMFMIGTVNI